MKPSEPITVGVVNYNGAPTIAGTLDSIRESRYDNIDKIIVLDNNSSDSSASIIKARCPQANLIRLDWNSGSAHARNRILREARTNMVLIIDNDITLFPGCLKKLAAVKQKAPSAGVVHPHIVDQDNPEQPQPYNGGWIHYLCAFIPRERFHSEEEYERFDAISGAAMLIDKKISSRIGGFDDDYFFNWEDGDFTFRLTQAGYPCLNVPSARVYHKSRPRGKSKVFYQVRNRWYFIFKTYSYKTVILCLPAFALYELSLAVLMAAKKSFTLYLLGNIHALIDAPATLRKRKKVQALRVKKDSELLKAGDFYVPESMLGGALEKKAQKLYSLVFRLYWEGIKDFL